MGKNKTEWSEQNGFAVSERLESLIKAAVKNKQYRNTESFANEIGIPIGTVRDHYKNGSNFGIRDLYKYSQALGVSSDYLLFGKEYSGPMDRPNEPTIEDVFNAIDVLIGFFGLGLFTTRPADSKNPYDQTILVINDDGIAKYIDSLYDLPEGPALEMMKEHGLYDELIRRIKNDSIQRSKSSPAIYSIDEVSE